MVALGLLERELVKEIVINDLDKGIYSFWRAILNETDRFIDAIKQAPIDMTEWHKQHEICLMKNQKYSFELGFATFYMNRTNRSGIIKGGVIGGQEQAGIWKLDARFNKNELIERIRKIAALRNKIHVYNKDIESFLIHYVPKYEENAFIYFDPPYFAKGKQLYLNFFNYDDHVRIEKIISSKVKCDWIITYDNAPQIEQIYRNYVLKKFELNYSVAKKRRAHEIVIFKKESLVPSEQLMCQNKIKFALS